MADEDLKKEEALQKALGANIGEEKELEFETEDKTLIYQTVRQLCDRIGIFPDADGYIRIVNRVNVEVLRQNRKSYMEAQKKKKEKAVAEEIVLLQVQIHSEKVKIRI